MKGMQFERSKLMSGRVDATGLETNMQGETVTVQMDWLFDYSQGALAFTRTLGEPGDLEQSHKHAIWSFSDRRIFYSDYDSHPRANVEPVSDIRSKGQLGSNGFLDLRAIGLVSHHQFYNCIEFSHAIEKLKADKETRLMDSGLVKVTFPTGGGHFRDSMFINTERGFTIERLITENGVTENGTFRLLSEVATPAQVAAMEARGVDMAKTYPDIAQEYSIQWSKISDVWVPVYIDCRVTEPAKKNKSKETSSPPVVASRYQLTLNLDWADVNVPLSEDSFALTQFRLPETTEIFDMRGETSIYLGKVADLRRDDTVHAPYSSNRPLVLFVFSCVVLMMIFGFRWKSSG